MKSKTLFSVLLACAISIPSALAQFSNVEFKNGKCHDPIAALASAENPLYTGMFSKVQSNNDVQKIAIKTIKGSPYLVENFEKANLYDSDKLVGTFYARYNAFNQDLEIKSTNLEEEEYMALIKSEDLRMVFADKELKYTSFIDESGKKQGDYLISMTQGDQYTMYQRYIVDFREGREAINSLVMSTPHKFVTRTEFYIKNMNTNLISEIPTKKSKLLDLFDGDEKIQIARLIKKNSLNLRDEMDLRKILQFANSMNKEYAVANE